MLPATLLAQGFGWRVAVGAPALIVLVMSGVALHALPAHRHWGCTEDDPRSRLVPGGLLPRKVTLGGVVKAYPHLLLLGLAYCFVKLARYLALLWLPLFLHERLGFSPPTAGFASTAFDAGGALGGGVWGTVADGRLLRGRRVCLAQRGLQPHEALGEPRFIRQLQPRKHHAPIRTTISERLHRVGAVGAEEDNSNIH